MVISIADGSRRPTGAIFRIGMGDWIATLAPTRRGVAPLCQIVAARC